MGNCLQCFQSSSTNNDRSSDSPRQNISTPICQSTCIESRGVCANANERHLFTDRSYETDELLSPRSPLNNANNCDTKRNSFKKSLVLLNGNAATMSDIISTVKESHIVTQNSLNSLFEEYKDPDEDTILADGIIRLCRDLDYQPDEFPILVLAWCLNASQMCRFTKSEFIEGLYKMQADNPRMIRKRLEQTIEMLKVDAEMFKQLYRFTFRFGLELEQRILSLNMAIDLWKLVFTLHTPDLLSNWINFLEQNPSIRGIPRDTWNMFLNFAEQCDIDTYDDTEAWPSLFDDYVDYEKLRITNAIGNATTSIRDDDNNNDDSSQAHQKISMEWRSANDVL